MKNKQKQLKIKEKNKLTILKKLKLRDQVKSIEGIFPRDHESDEIKNELCKIKRYEAKVIRDNLFYEPSKQVYDLRVFKLFW